MTCYVVISIIKTMTVAICLTLTGASRGSCPCCSGTLLEPEHTSFVCCLSTLASEQPQWRCGKASTMMADLVPEHRNVMQQFLSLKLAKDQLLMGIWSVSAWNCAIQWVDTSTLLVEKWEVFASQNVLCQVCENHVVSDVPNKGQHWSHFVLWRRLVSKKFALV